LRDRQAADEVVADKDSLRRGQAVVQHDRARELRSAQADED
jgi:hypothetical protein